MIAMGIWAPDPYLADALFDATSPLNRDDCLAAFRILRDRLDERGGCCHTIDVFRARGEAPDVVVFLDVPPQPAGLYLAGWRQARAWVVLQECEVIAPRNWDAERLAEFETIFTWRDAFVDDDRFVKLNFPNALTIPERFDLDTAERNLCVMIAGNKRADHPLELYSRRVEVIRWFERHHLDEFALYGVGWGGPALGTGAQACAEPFPSWCGTVKAKRVTLRDYWFSICFENARGIPGYITEKLFDCLLAGTVPIYLGANNITDHVPADCFIDARQFTALEQVYDAMVTTEPARYQQYLDAAREFLASSAARPFSVEEYADTLVRRIATCVTV